jgi:hypothetical protein
MEEIEQGGDVEEGDEEEDEEDEEDEEGVDVGQCLVSFHSLITNPWILYLCNA